MQDRKHVTLKNYSKCLPVTTTLKSPLA